MIEWVPAEKIVAEEAAKIPERKQTYRSGLVVVQPADSQHRPRIRYMYKGELRFIGNDASRPLWYRIGKGEPHEALENSSLIVTHFAEFNWPVEDDDENAVEE